MIGKILIAASSSVAELIEYCSLGIAGVSCMLAPCMATPTLLLL